LRRVSRRRGKEAEEEGVLEKLQFQQGRKGGRAGRRKGRRAGDAPFPASVA
jgi:hypothetical protein